MSTVWKTSKRELDYTRPLVMAILNVTPDSFSDGGEYITSGAAVRRAERSLAEGADILDIGGESTRPGSKSVSAGQEIDRVLPVIEAIVKRFDIPVSVDTTKSAVAEAAVAAGAEIINDISGLRFDEDIAGVSARSGAGLILMHSRGDFRSMHSGEPAEDVLTDVRNGFHRSIDIAKARGVTDSQIALDVGIGFGKTFQQNLELLAKLDKIVSEFKGYPMLVGVSRKSFIGRILGDVPAVERLGGSIAAALVAVRNGARIVRVHDVKETVAAVRVATRIALI
jgi:dihydropteroate synthase